MAEDKKSEKEEKNNKTPKKVPEEAPKKKDSNPSQEEAPIDPEIIKDLPPEVQKRVIEMMSFRSHISGPAPNPLYSKINEQHIEKLIEQSATEENHAYELEKTSKKHNIFYFIVAIAVFIFLIIFLVDDRETLFDILKGFALFGGGSGLGYGYKTYQVRRDS